MSRKPLALIEAEADEPALEVGVHFRGGGVGFRRARDREALIARLHALLDEAIGALNDVAADCPVQTPTTGWHVLAAARGRLALRRWRRARDRVERARARPDADVAAELAEKLRATAAAHEQYGPRAGRNARAAGLRWAARIVEREALPGGGDA